MPRFEIALPKTNEVRSLERRIKNILAKELTETMNYSFVGEEALKKLGVEYGSYIRLANPITRQLALLRQNLAPGLIQNIVTNQARYNMIELFEIGSIYAPLEGGLEKGGASSEKLPYEEKRLGIIAADSDPQAVFLRLKSILAYLLRNFNLETTFLPAETSVPWADKSAVAKVAVGETVLGFVYLVDGRMGERNGLRKPAAIAEISLRELLVLAGRDETFNYRETPKYPPAVRDLAFVVGDKVLYADILKEILAFHRYIGSAELFDVFSGGRLGAGKKNLAFHITYQAGKTLKSEEVDKLQSGLVKKLEERFGAKIRNF